MRIVLIGAGSRSFGLGQVVDVLRCAELRGRDVTLALVDENAHAHLSYVDADLTRLVYAENTGGAWNLTQPDALKIVNRNGDAPDQRNSFTGFRVVVGPKLSPSE